MHTAYDLRYEEDGVYLEVNTRRIADLDRDGLMQHLHSKRISGLNEEFVKTLMVYGGYTRVAPAQTEHIYEEELSIETAKPDSSSS